MATSHKIVLQDSLDLNKLVSSGSVIAINEDFIEEPTEFTNSQSKVIDFLGHPVKSIEEYTQHPSVVNIDDHGYVKKRIIEDGGGTELHEGCTVSIAYSGYWENETEPFDARTTHKPLVIDLKDNGLLPGLQIAVKSMLVGEMSMFILAHNLMYGELGIPPRIKPKSTCVFYVKLVRSVLTPEHGPINTEQQNGFRRVLREATLLHASGLDLSKTKNYYGAISLFKKAVNILHRTRLADEAEEKIQAKLLIKLYTNLAICNNKVKQPLQTCIACNELHRLKNIWQDSKIMYANGKALRNIGAYDEAEKRLKRALKISPNREEIVAELELLKKDKVTFAQRKMAAASIGDQYGGLVSKEFRNEVDAILKNFKMDPEMKSFELPAGLGPAERDFVKNVCLTENLFCTIVDDAIRMDRDDISVTENEVVDDAHSQRYGPNAKSKQLDER